MASARTYDRSASACDPRFGRSQWDRLRRPIDAPTHSGPCPLARRPDDRCCREMMEESPGSTGIRCRLTAGGGDPRDSATENKPPARPCSFGGTISRAWVKRCGKSAPRLRQRRRQGKPHREQDRIGAAALAFTGGARGHSRPAARVGRVRRAVRRVPEEWSSREFPQPGWRRSRTEPGLQAVWRFFHGRGRPAMAVRRSSRRHG